MEKNDIPTCKNCVRYKSGWCKAFKIWISERAKRCDEAYVAIPVRDEVKRNERKR